MRKLILILAMLLAFSYFGPKKAAAIAVCPTCGVNNNYNNLPYYNMSGNYGMPTFFSPYSYYPWYYPFGAMSYSNFFYPGPWYGSGINYNYYPGPGPQPGGGGGGCFAAKPNLYMSGPAGAKLNVSLTLKNANSNWLAAVPALEKNTWTATLTEKGIKSGNAEYNYFFYDFRTAENDLQDTTGFCTDKDKLIQKMATVLKKNEFKEAEIKDFVEHWSFKIPPSNKFCVYPQIESDLNKAVEVTFTPAPKSYKRILFVVVPDEYRTAAAGHKFGGMPKSDFSGKIPGDRMPASASGQVDVREWGVGFLAAFK